MDSKTVLCVADETSLHDIRQQLIQSAGFSVLATSSGRDAVTRFVSHPVDAVVLDCALPDVDRVNLTTTVKKLKPRIPVILLGDKPPIADTGFTMVDAFIRNKASDRGLLVSRLGALVNLRSHSHSELEQEYVVFADASRHYLDCSDGVCALLGYSRMELVGMTIEDVSFSSEEVSGLFAKFVKSGQQDGEYVLKHRSGRPVLMRYQAYVFSDGCIAAVWHPLAGWKQLYSAALVEVEPTKLKVRVEAAETAIHERIRELETENQRSTDEWQSLQDAVAGLRMLSREFLS